MPFGDHQCRCISARFEIDLTTRHQIDSSGGLTLPPESGHGGADVRFVSNGGMNMSKFLKPSFIVAALVLITAPALAWDGVNIESGDVITIEDGVAIAEGNNIKIMAADSKAQRSVTITTITQTDEAIEITVVDDTSGETQIFDFDPAEMPDTVDLPEPK